MGNFIKYTKNKIIFVKREIKICHSEFAVANEES